MKDGKPSACSRMVVYQVTLPEDLDLLWQPLDVCSIGIYSVALFRIARDLVKYE